MSSLKAPRLTTWCWRRLAAVLWLVLVGQVPIHAQVVSTFVSTNVPLNIPLNNNTGGVQPTVSTLRVSNIISDVSNVVVTLYVSHRWPADLRITLIPPEGPVAAAGVRLLAPNVIFSTQVPNDLDPIAPYSNRSSFSTGLGTGLLPEQRVAFSDSGVVIDPDNITHVNNVYNFVHLLPGTYAPDQPLAAFNGMAPAQSNGTWQLRIEDIYPALDSGTLLGWSLIITEPGAHIWTGATNTDWGTASNWVNDNLPSPSGTGALLIFPASAAGTVNNATANDYRVRKWIIDGAYTFTTSSTGKLTLLADATVTVNSPTDVNMAIPIDLIGQPTITVNGAGSFNLTGTIANDGGAAGGLIFAGPGPKRMSGANTYTGVTAVNDGILEIGSNTGLGSAAGGTTVAYGATLRLDAGVNSPDTITIQGTGDGDIGSLVFSSGGSVGGMTLVANQPTTISVLGGASTINNVTVAPATAIHTLTVTNAGTLAINGALPFTTALTLIGGDTTFGAIQPNISTLALRSGADLDVGTSTTVNGGISVGASGDISTITGTTLNLGAGNRSINVVGGAAGLGGEANTTSSDLLITANMTGSGFTKQGGGVMRITGDNTGVNATVSGGTLAGEGNIGSINVVNGALSPSGEFTVSGNVNLSSRTGFILPLGATANPAINAAGEVALNGVGGLGGAVLQPYTGDGNTIITAASVTGTFDGKPDGAGITYNPTSVVLGASGGRSLAFTPAGPFVVDEFVGTLDVTVTATPAGGAIPVLRVFGEIIEGRDVSLVGLAPAGTYVFTIPINDNFVDTGDLTGTLAIVPQDGSLVTNSATLTIRDNDASSVKKCGFGTGFTVFFLLGFALLLRLRRS